MTYSEIPRKRYKKIPSQHLSPGAITGAKDTRHRAEMLKTFYHIGCSLYKHWSGGSYLGIQLHMTGHILKDHPQARRNMETDEPMWSNPKYVPAEIHEWLWNYYKSLPKPKHYQTTQQRS